MIEGIAPAFKWKTNVRMPKPQFNDLAEDIPAFISPNSMYPSWRAISG